MCGQRDPLSLQMIHAATTEIGCTYNVCGNKFEIFCLYDERANMINQPVYDTGKPCKIDKDCTTYRKSRCDAKTGLCLKRKEKPDDNTSNICSPVYGMTDKVRNTILDLHNDYRYATFYQAIPEKSVNSALAYVQGVAFKFRSILARGEAEDKLGTELTPQGASMLKMEYNCELERIASTYARYCRYEHSDKSRRTLSGERYAAGENLYTVSIDNVEKNKAGVWMVWGNTDKIGCGIQHCLGVRTLVVCNYMKGGNFINSTTYELGEPCSKCPQGYKKCTPDKLCSRK
ncbi:SCP-like protein [Ancylostoma duodenale]|uniref:SCP-like protein n=1 Tax=Ancylostoma duodenale TaxID=51022 RepID=A0A0C2DC45_9BILA|nr:SCP-like protein [Ancylostoma duodenale]